MLAPGGLLYFTVNVHHPIYDLISRAYGAWNGVGIKLELSAFGDHTVHLTESQIASALQDEPLEILERKSTSPKQYQRNGIQKQ